MIAVQGISKRFAVPRNAKRSKAKKVDPRISPDKQWFQVLSDVSFSAKPGEIYGLLGPNGAGKTTALRCIATLLKIDSGSITVNGLDCQKQAKQVRASIGMLTSDMKLSGNLSPRELIEFFGRLNHLSPEVIAKRTDELCSYLSMEDFMDQAMEKCSTGQKQKTSIAVALVHDPDVILFDEPTNGLDILAARTVVNFLQDFKSRGKTIILSTHIMAEAETLCDRIGIMLNGKIVSEGSLSELTSQWGATSLSDAFFKAAEQEGVTSDA